MVVLTALAVIALAAAARAADPPPPTRTYNGFDSHPSGGGYSEHGGSYGGYGSYDSGYGSSRFGGYGGGSRYGYQPYPYGYMRDMVSADHEKPLTPVDKLWERLDDTARQNKFAAEQIDALDARMSLIKKFVDELGLLVLPGQHQEDLNLNNDLDRLDDHLNNLMNALNELENNTDWLDNQNAQNADDVQNDWVEFANTKRQDTMQDGGMARLDTAVKDFKSRLFTVMGNEFELFNDRVEQTTGKLAGIKNRELSRMCETGTVTLSRDDRKAELQFQSEFDEVPSILYSISGIKADLDTRDDPAHYGYGPPPKEPNSLGAVVQSYATTKGVVFEIYDTSFGDTQLESLDIDYQACSIGAGTVVSDVHDL